MLTVRSPPNRGKISVQVAAGLLHLSVTHAYRLLERFEADPRLTSLLPARRGRKHGHRRLSEMVEDIIQAAIDEVYLTRQKPRVTVLMDEIRRRCPERNTLNSGDIGSRKTADGGRQGE